MTVISRNGRDHMNSSAAFRMVARVRSDFVILGVGREGVRNVDANLLITDIVSVFSDALSTICRARSEFTFHAEPDSGHARAKKKRRARHQHAAGVCLAPRFNHPIEFPIR